MKVLKNFGLLTLGAAVGSAITYVLVKNKYERISREEIESMRNAFEMQYGNSLEECSDEETDISEEVPEIKPEHPEVDFNVYKQLAGQYDRVNYNGYSEPKKEDEKSMDNNVNNHTIYPVDTAIDNFKPIPDPVYSNISIVSGYNIDEFDEEIITLYFTADGFLVGEDSEIQEPYQKYVGEEFRNYLREGGSDEIFVHNSTYSVIYDVLRSAKTYDEFLGESPWVIRDED